MTTTGWIILIVVLFLVFGGGLGLRRRRWIGQVPLRNDCAVN